MTRQHAKVHVRSVARAIYAAAVLFFGAQHFMYGAFVTRLVPSWSGPLAESRLAVHGVGALLIGVGFALLFKQTARGAAMLLGGLLVISVVYLHLPKAIPDVLWAGTWTAAGKALVMLGGGFAVAASHDCGHLPASAVSKLVDALAPLGTWMLAAFMVLAGIQHVVWDQFVATLVPAWIPPGAYFWTYAAAVFLVAGGVGMLWRRTRRLAAGLSALMIFLWVPLLHIPRAIASPPDESNEWTAVFEALAFSAIACLTWLEREPVLQDEPSPSVVSRA